MEAMVLVNSDLSAGDMTKAIGAWMRSNKYLPTPAEIRELVQRMDAERIAAIAASGTDDASRIARALGHYHVLNEGKYRHEISPFEIAGEQRSCLHITWNDTGWVQIIKGSEAPSALAAEFKMSVVFHWQGPRGLVSDVVANRTNSDVASLCDHRARILQERGDATAMIAKLGNLAAE